MELTERIAKDIDDMLALAVERGFPNGFDISWYQRNVRPDMDKNYLFYLVGLINHYMLKKDRKWVIVDHNRQLECNGSTKAFLDGGGFRKIYEEERQQELKNETDLKLAQQTLKDYPWTKWLARLGFIIALGLAVLELIKFLKGK